LRHDSNSALKDFQRIGEALKNEQCTVEICARLTIITSGDFPENGFTDCPFVFLEGSSGSGKSQMAFSIQAHMSSQNSLTTQSQASAMHVLAEEVQEVQRNALLSELKRLPKVLLGDQYSKEESKKIDIAIETTRYIKDVYYFLFSPPSSMSQQIYLNFQELSSLFSKCCEGDATVYNADAVSPSCSSLFSKSLFVYGFIYELLSTGLTGRNVNVQRKTGSEIRDLLIRKGVGSKRPIFIIDECIAISDESLKKVRFVRNCFRSLGMGLVMLGTDSRAAKLPQTMGGSSRSGISFPWCFVFGQFPGLRLDLLVPPGLIPDWLTPILKNSRPLFSQLVVGELAKDSGVNDFDQLMKRTFTIVAGVKGIFGNYFGKLGQLRLFQNAHCSLADFSSQSTPLIHSHFAQLHGKKKNFLLMSSGCVSDNDDSQWNPSSVFPRVENDVLLYLLLMGGKEYPACRIEGKMVPYAHFLMQTKGQPDFRSNILDYSNSAQTSNDGMFLESLLCSTVCLASHSDGFGGVGLKPFLLNLVFQLQAENVSPSGVSVKDLNLLDGLGQFLVPFLSPPNQEWPSFLVIPNSNFGNLERTSNRDKIDLWASCGIAGESKDYASEIGLDVMKKILERIPENAKVELVFTKKLQQSYFNPPALTFNKVFAGSHLLKKAYFKINASKPETVLEAITGLPSQDDGIVGVVIFVEIDPRLKV